MEITQQEALACFASNELIGIGMEADAVRRALHPENVVTYTAARSFRLDPGHDCAYTALFASLGDAASAGDTTICLAQPPDSIPELDTLTEILTRIRQRYPTLRLQALSTSNALGLVQRSGLGLDEVLHRLRAAGLDAISGEDLCVASSVPSGCVPLEAWLAVHRLAHQAGIVSTAGLVFGLGETAEERAGGLFAIRSLQAETSGFGAFTLRTLAAADTHLEAPTAVEYLRTLAIARMVLDNVPNLESNCLAHGLKVAQMALRFGANDAGWFFQNDSTHPATFTEEDLRRVIRDAGFIPVERDPLYRTVFLSN